MYALIIFFPMFVGYCYVFIVKAMLKKYFVCNSITIYTCYWVVTKQIISTLTLKNSVLESFLIRSYVTASTQRIKFSFTNLFFKDQKQACMYESAHFWQSYVGS